MEHFSDVFPYPWLFWEEFFAFRGQIQIAASLPVPEAVKIDIGLYSSQKYEFARDFMHVTKEGFEWAANNPDAAAEILCLEVAKDYAHAPLPTPLDADMVAESQVQCATT